MFAGATPVQAHAILRAMKVVASLGGAAALSTADQAALIAAGHYVFRLSADPDSLEPITPAALAAAVTDAGLRREAAQSLAVMALVDGAVDGDKIASVTRFAAALDIHDDFIKTMTEAAQGHLRWAGMDMVRHNMLSITGQPWAEADVMPWLLPYQGDQADPALTARFEALQNLPEESLGHTFWHHYRHHGFTFPGQPDALNARFAVPHDTTHLLSGYSTTYRGEILVSTFTAGMHPEEPMAGHILPVIFSWHLGIELIEHAGSHRGGLDPSHFWEAWSRGQATKGDAFAPDWNFWALIERPLAELQVDYGVPPREAED
ncbi:MAG: hypothetical protein AAF495_27480 [Pseudomonadota bacterium]